MQKRFRNTIVPMLQTRFSSSEDLNSEHEAYKRLSGFVHGAYLLAALVVGLWCIAQIINAGSIFALRAIDIGKLALGVPITIYLLSAVNSQRGPFQRLSIWEQSLLKRRELEETKDALKNGGRAVIDGKEVELVDGYLAPKRVESSAPTEKLSLQRMKFDPTRFRALSSDEQVFFVRLAHVADDLRHVFYLSVAAEGGTHSSSGDERKLALHQLLFCVRLIYSILNEAWVVIDTGWNGNKLGRTWHPRLSPKGREGLAFLGKYFGQQNLSRTIRNEFGFHYSAEPVREPIAHIPKRAAEIITGMSRRNIFFTIAEEVRALALLNATRKTDEQRLWDEQCTEEDIRAAVIELYEGYRPVRDAFENFANNVLVTIVRSLQPTNEHFELPRSTRFSDMLPVLFVEEPQEAST